MSDQEQEQEQQNKALEQFPKPNEFHNVFLNGGIMLHFSIDQQLVYIIKEVNDKRSNLVLPNKPNTFYTEKEREKRIEENNKKIEEQKEILKDNRPYQAKDEIIHVGKKVSYLKMINKNSRNPNHKREYEKMKRKDAYAPSEIKVGLLRDQLTLNNISEVYSGIIIQLAGTSIDFLNQYLVSKKNERITKTKGHFNDNRDVLVKKWIVYNDVPQNQTIFKLEARVKGKN